MAQARLARLEKVVLREVWGDDAGEFIDWLKQPGNISFLGNALGADLRLADATGDSKLDIQCQDAGNHRPVLVKVNFDGASDDHVGQLVMAAAGKDEVTLVLVADKITDQVASALRWLNRITPPAVNLYGLEVDFWRIADSAFAPTLTLAIRPGDEARSQSETVRPKITPMPVHPNVSAPQSVKSGSQFLEYWLAFNGNLLHRKSTVIGQKPTSSNWMSFPMGGPNFSLIATVSPRDHFIAVGLVLGGADAKSNFQLLQHSKVSIENEIGAPLEWQELPDKPESRILLRRYGVDPDNRQNWEEQHEWLADKLERFQKAFVLRVEALNTDEESSSDSASENPKHDQDQSGGFNSASA